MAGRFSAASPFPPSMPMAGQLRLLQHFVGPFLHHLHLRSTPRGATTFCKEALTRLQQELDAYSGALESQKKEETRTAERLVQALFLHRVLLCNSNGASYIKIVQKLWEFEDQGLLSRSSLINDLAVRTLLEAHHMKICRSAVASAFRSMFITSSQENKGVLVDAMLCAICMRSDLLSVWHEAIICGIGNSVMRLNVVELALLDRCMSDDAIVKQKAGPLLCCIKAAFLCPLFNCDKIRQAIYEKISYSGGQASLCYISFFQDLAEIDKVDSMVYINFLIKFLGEKKGLDMAIQTALYNAIDCLKRRSSENVYKVPYFQAFSEKWLL